MFIMFIRGKHNYVYVPMKYSPDVGITERKLKIKMKKM